MKRTAVLKLSVCAAVLLTVASSPARSSAALAEKPTVGGDNGGGQTVFAGPIPLVSGGGWVSVFWSGSGQPIPADDGPFTFTTSSHSNECITAVDIALKGDRFELSDNGTFLGRTSLVGLGSGTTGDPDVALADPTYSSGRFAVDGGSHSIEIQIIANPYGGGGFWIRLDPQGSSYCPDPNPIDALEAKLDALGATDVEPQVQALESKLDVVEVKLDALEAKVDALPLPIDALEAKLDAVEIKLDGLPQDVAALESKLDVVEVKLDALPPQVGALEAKLDALPPQVDALEAKLDAVEVKLDALGSQVTDLKAEIVAVAGDESQALLDRIAKACMDKKHIAEFYLPAANGGNQAKVRQLAADTIVAVSASGESTNSAATYLTQGDLSVGFGRHKQAYRLYCIAYCRAVSDTLSKCIDSW